MPDSAQKQGDFVESRLSNVELGGVNGVKRGKSLTPGVKVIKISQRHRRLFSIDAIGIGVLAGESIEEWLKIKGF